jgi:hypothetical protein
LGDGRDHIVSQVVRLARAGKRNPYLCRETRKYRFDGADLRGLYTLPARFDAYAPRALRFGAKGSAAKKFIELTIL